MQYYHSTETSDQAGCDRRKPSRVGPASAALDPVLNRRPRAAGDVSVSDTNRDDRKESPRELSSFVNLIVYNRLRGDEYIELFEFTACTNNMHFFKKWYLPVDLVNSENFYSSIL